ncbi:MAG: siroheme synthase [Desulfuromonas sp.]|nr:MAG: siroheme synthase [Desulfuromonas sp.]
MRAYPVQLNLKERLCVVVGGGCVGLRKAQGLLASSARVRLVEPRDAAPACALEGVERLARRFVPDDLEGALLAFAASDDPEVNRQVAAAASQRGVLCNRADDATGGDFSLPAQLRRGELLMTVSSGGSHPGLAAALRDRLAGEFDDSWAFIADLAQALRRRRLTPDEAKTYNPAVMHLLMDARLPDLVAKHDRDGIERLINETLGSNLSLDKLKLSFPTESS